jgi:2-keto-4-pentenoate hydratase/2-oxohepta-3-ene-1,7-dioic acid hydratase in catechol pathway
MKSLYVTKDNQIFISPDSAIVSRGNPWFMPEDAVDWQGKVLIGTCITRLGMYISQKFAPRYYKNFIAAVHTFSPNANASVQWCRDGALVTGPGLVDANVNDKLSLSVDNSALAEVDTESLRETINKTIAYVSTYITLKTGDLILLDSNIDPFNITEGFDFDVTFGSEKMLHFKTR